MSQPLRRPNRSVPKPEMIPEPEVLYTVQTNAINYELLLAMGHGDARKGLAIALSNALQHFHEVDSHGA